MSGATPTADLDALRAKIRAIEGGPRVVRRRVPTGVEALDALVEGLPVPGIVEICGREGSGRSRLALTILARATASHTAVAWVDPLKRLYPPAAADLGVALEQLLVVRPPEDGSTPWAWATEQLLRSGCFGWVVVDLPPRSGSRRALSHTWARAAEYGCCTVIAISERPTRELPADVRLSVGEGRLFVVRDRGGRAGGGVPWG
ncbi:MAG: hypothetical protein KTR31_08390 [Myxococcales bacterium]|nr:hypothetical protein [Myxococcales bacterium]